MVKSEVSPNLKVQTFAFTYSNDKFLKTVVACKYAILQPLHIQQGWEILLMIIITFGIRRVIYTTTTKCLQDVQMATLEIHKLMESFPQIAIRYLEPQVTWGRFVSDVENMEGGTYHFARGPKS